MPTPQTLLVVLAHPDDESFGPGGTLARYADQGVQVHVVIGTDGDAGSTEANYQTKNGQTLAQERQEELARAAVALGITSIWNLPYRDSGMRGSPDNQHPHALIQQPVESLVHEIVGYMRRLRPQVVLTHDPYGGYGHPDHIRLCEATTAAFHLAGDRHYPCRQAGVDLPPHKPQKLYYTTLDKRFVKMAVRIMQLTGKNPREMGRNKDIDLVEISGWETPVHARVDVAAYLGRKEAASQAHASQYSGGPGFFRMIPEFLRARMLGTESFTRAFPAPPPVTEQDLFAGVV